MPCFVFIPMLCVHENNNGITTTGMFKCWSIMNSCVNRGTLNFTYLFGKVAKRISCIYYFVRLHVPLYDICVYCILEHACCA